jgi:Mg-chelatase subunit ChlD
MVKKILCAGVTIAAVCLTCFSATAADVVTLRAGQAVSRHPEIKVYIDALDQSGIPVDALSAGQISATVGQIQADVREIKRFDQSGEGVGYVFLVDISRSLSSGQFDQMKAAINLWVDKMRETDRSAIISFGENVTTVQDYTADQNALKNGVKTLAMSDNKTQLHQGIAKAIEMSHRIDATLPSRRVIVMLSDGEDDFPGGMTRGEVLAAMKEDRIPVYAIGFSQQGKKGDANLKTLGEFARMSGGEFFDGNRAELGKLYESIQQKILKSCFGEAGCNKNHRRRKVIPATTYLEQRREIHDRWSRSPYIVANRYNARENSASTLVQYLVQENPGLGICCRRLFSGFNYRPFHKGTSEKSCQTCCRRGRA